MMKLLAFLFLLYTPIMYSQSFMIKEKIKLSKKVEETSGIVLIDNEILTFNDSGGKPELYVINPKSGKIKRTIAIKNAKNVDWESITQDVDHVYIGDTGNNYGNRKNLVIYKIKKSDLKSDKSVIASKINFSYDDQTSFEIKKHNNNFDCESITIYKNKLLLFTKNWVNHRSNIYTIPVTEGTFVAKKTNVLNINCLLTSVDYNAATNSLIATAYNKEYEAFLILVKNFSLTSSSFIKMDLTPVLSYANQVEGVAWKNNNEIYITREASKKKLGKNKYTHKQKLLRITLID